MAKRKPNPPIKPGNGKGDGRRTPAQLERQEKVFLMNVVECKSIRAIARELGLSKSTVEADIKHEAELRAKEREQRRGQDLEIALTRYQGVIIKAEKKSALYDTLLEEREGAKISDHSLEAVLKAQERIDKLLGLEAPTRVDLGVQALVDALTPKE